MIHALIALLIQTVVGYATGNWWAGVVVAMFYVGREHAQAEYRWIERFGFRRRANMPWWGGFDPKVWNLKSLTDWSIPLSATTAIAVIAG